MLNIQANLGSQRLSLSSLSRDMGLGGQRERDEAVPEKGPSDSANGTDAAAPVLSERPIEDLDTLAQARRLAAEQRIAAQSLLDEARALEEQLLHEATASREARKRADEMAALVGHAMAAEQEARERGRLAAERHSLVDTERQRIEAVLTASRLASEAATAEIAELKQRLEDVLRVAADAAALLRAQEERAAEVAAKAIASEKELSEAASQLAERQAAREAAEKEARAAQELAAARKSAAKVA